MEPAKIPFHLGKCEILKTHDDGDITAQCGDKKYVITTEGEVFTELDIGYYGALAGEIFKKYLKGKMSREQYEKEIGEIEDSFKR